MTTVLEGVKARYEAVMSDDLTGPKPKALRRILRTDIPLLLAVAEAAVAEWNTHRIWKEADENLDDTDEAWDEIWQRIDAAHDAFRAAIEPLLEGEE